MTQDKRQWKKVGSQDEMVKWVKDLREELYSIKTTAAGMEGLEPLKVRLEAVAVEAKLVETFISAVAKPFEVMEKLVSEKTSR